MCNNLDSASIAAREKQCDLLHVKHSMWSTNSRLITIESTHYSVSKCHMDKTQ